MGLAINASFGVVTPYPCSNHSKWFIILLSDFLTVYGMAMFDKPAANSAPVPSIRVDAEYISSLRIKNPDLLTLLRDSNGEADTQLSLNVNAHAAGNDTYRIVLQVRIQVGAGKSPNFSIDLDYEGLFFVSEVTESILPVILFVECPRFLFPSVRHIVTTLTQSSGLPPFHMQPINFMDMFQKKIKEQSGKVAQSGTPSEG
jgi:preprotein translocase subunit SecB